MLFDRQLQRIVTEGTFRHGRNCARSRITRKITAPGPWPDSVAKANTRFCYSINCEPPAHMYKQGCPIFYWPFSSLNTQWAKTSRCVSNEEKPRCDSTGIARGIIKRRNERVRRREKRRALVLIDDVYVISSFLHNSYFRCQSVLSQFIISLLLLLFTRKRIISLLIPLLNDFNVKEQLYKENRLRLEFHQLRMFRKSTNNK